MSRSNYDVEKGVQIPLMTLSTDKRLVVNPNRAGLGYPAYQVIPLTSDYECKDTNMIQFVEPHSFGWKLLKGIVSLALLPITLIALPFRLRNIPQGSIGVSQSSGRPEFLGPGWHFLGSPLRSLEGVVSLNHKRTILNLTRGIVTVEDGHVGVALDRGRYILLGPGMHQWNSDTFQFLALVKLEDNVVKMGPFTVITVPPGEVAITEDNGMLKILEGNAETGQRTHFLNHSKWVFKGFLSTQPSIDSLVTSKLLTADRVEVALDSTVSWKVIDPHAAAARGGHNMDSIRALVDRAARAALSNMIALRNISGKSVGHMADSKKVESTEEQRATAEQLDNCNFSLHSIGVEISQIAIVQMTISHEDTRKEIAKIAAIPAKTKELREVAEAQAENVIVAAQGQARAIREIAMANAEAIKMTADAQRQAGEMLGGPQTTASQLACIEANGRAIGNSKSSMFFVPPGNLSGLFANPNLVGAK